MHNSADKADVLGRLKSRIPQLWLNPCYSSVEGVLSKLFFSYRDIVGASNRLDQSASLLLQLFPELKDSQGIIESPLIRADNLGKNICEQYEKFGNIFVKSDHCLPIAGSIKARGGIYEVLVIADQIAEKTGMHQDFQTLSNIPAKKREALFSEYTISVGSTGNLGLSIGIVSSALGFRSVVHMSSEAKTWKKQILRERGVEVIEHSGDYAAAVSAGRNNSQADPFNFFIDDENSSSLFLGYSVAAMRLKSQLIEKGVTVDEEHPLFVYLPCGVGGAPGGITFGLKHLFGDHVHCFFAEPVDAPCMLMQLATQRLSENLNAPLSVYDIGLTNKTQADGLAVSSASNLVSSLIKELVSGIYTVTDDRLLRDLYKAGRYGSIKIEPSASAGLSGPKWLLGTEEGALYQSRCLLKGAMRQSTHIIWTTGGQFIPDKEYQILYERGRSLQSNNSRNKVFSNE